MALRSGCTLSRHAPTMAVPRSKTSDAPGAAPPGRAGDAGDESAKRDEARRHFDRVAGMIADRRPFEQATDPMDDLDTLEAATALSLKRT